MIKDIKDYLHLYVGEAQVKYEGSESIYYLTLSELSIALRVAREVKLILRPLSDMTEEERESQEMVYMRMQEMQDEEGHICDAEIWAETTRWACKQGFDMFQLIESGLAIDATTIKQNA